MGMGMVEVYRRHLFIWRENENKLEGFLQSLSTLHLNLKCTHEKPIISIKFLDVVVRINGNKSERDPYSSSTDCHQLLEFNLAHPLHIKKRIVYSQGLRIKKLCLPSLAFAIIISSYVLGLGTVVTPRKLWTINLGGQQKTDQSSYMNMKHNTEPVSHLQLHTILALALDSMAE